ncbi:membrane protein ORF114 [Cyprinid herpesvirus 3]|nr:membrane protein ORF114 [Cyprinid herpesvirus 3]
MTETEDTMLPARLPSLQQGKKLAVTLLVGVCLCMTVVAVCFNGLAAVGLGPFHNTSNDLALNRFPTKLTASGWTPGIWGFVYVCLIVINLHLFACRFWRPSVHHLDDAGKRWPSVFYYPVWLAVTVLDILRLVMWDAQVFGAAAGTIVFYTLLTACITVCLVFALREPITNMDHFRILIKNTLGLYAGWCTFETATSLAAAIQHEGLTATSGADDVAGILALVCLTALYVIYVVLDFVYIKYTKQLYTIHISLMWGIMGILFAQTYTYPTIYAAVLGGIMFLVFCIKVALCLSHTFI